METGITIKTSRLEEFCAGQGYEIFLPWEEDDIDEIDLSLYEEYEPNTVLAGCKLYLSDDYDFLCMFLGREIVAVCSCFTYTLESIIGEIHVLVDTKLRHHKIGSTIVDVMLEITDADETYLVGSVSAFADYMGAEFSHCEHLMVVGPTVNKLLTTPLFVHKKLTVGPTTLTGSIDNIEVCSLQLDCFGDYVCISQVFTHENYRRNGYASDLFVHAFNMFPDKKFMLQVSGSNQAAISLYIKLGFNFSETTEYYRIE